MKKLMITPLITVLLTGTTLMAQTVKAPTPAPAVANNATAKTEAPAPAKVKKQHRKGKKTAPAATTNPAPVKK